MREHKLLHRHFQTVPLSYTSLYIVCTHSIHSLNFSLTNIYFFVSCFSLSFLSSFVPLTSFHFIHSHSTPLFPLFIYFFLFSSSLSLFLSFLFSLSFHHFNIISTSHIHVNLQTLHVVNQIGKEGAQALAQALPNSPSLTHLNLRSMYTLYPLIEFLSHQHLFLCFLFFTFFPFLFCSFHIIPFHSFSFHSSFSAFYLFFSFLIFSLSFSLFLIFSLISSFQHHFHITHPCKLTDFTCS